MIRPSQVTQINEIDDTNEINKRLVEINRQLDMLFSAGNYSQGTGSSSTTALLSVWNNSTRPALPTFGLTGYNTDKNGLETYTPTGWFVNGGTWTTATRPTGVIVGSWGYNTTIKSREYYDGVSPDGGWNAA